MKKIAVIYPAGVYKPEPNEIIKKAVGDCKMLTITDDTLIQDVVANGGLNADLTARTIGLFIAADRAHPDLIILGCSSIGKTAYVAQEILNTPIMRIDEGMAREAVAHYKKIGVMATLATTVGPTCDLIKDIAAEEGKEIELMSDVADGAFDAFLANEPDRAEAIIKDKFLELASKCECVIFAQASMTNMKERFAKICDTPILTSPEYCAPMAAKFLNG